MAEHKEQIPKQESLNQDSDVLGYLQYLPYHLYNTKQYAPLHELIDYPWMEMRRGQFSGSYEGFLNDIELASDSPIPDSNKWMSLQVRYAFMKSSIKSLASKVPPELYPLLVKHDFWGLAEATTNALNIIEPEIKCKALIYLAEIPQVSLQNKEILYREILYTNWKPTDSSRELWVFRALAPRLPNTLILDAVQVTNRKSFENRYAPISALLPFLEDTRREIILDQLISDARNLPDTRKCILALKELAPYLDEELLTYILHGITKAGLDNNEKRDVLLKIAGFLPLHLHEEALNVMNDFGDETYKVEVLISLAEQKHLELSNLFDRFRIQPIPDYLHPPTTPEGLRNKELNMALDIMLNLDASDPRGKKLDCLIVLGVSSLNLIESHETVLQGIGENWSIDGQIFEIFYPRFSALDKEKAIDLLLTKAREDYSRFLYSCSKIAPRINHQHAVKLLTNIYALIQSGDKNIKDENMIEAIGSLICQVGDSGQLDWLNRVFPLLSSIDDKKDVEFAANRFAQYSGETEIFTIRELFDMFGDEMIRMEFESILRQIKRTHKTHSADWILLVQNLIDLIPFLGISQVSDIIDAFAEYEEEVGDIVHNYEAFLLSKSIKYIPNELYEKLINHVTRHGCYCYRSVMFDLVNYLPNQLLAKALLRLNTLEKQKNREMSYYNLSPYFTEELVNWLVEKENLNEQDEDALLELLDTHRKPDMDFDEAFKICNHLLDDDFDYLLLSWLPYLKDAQFEQWIHAGFRVVFKQIHWTTFPETFPCIRLAPYLPFELYIVMLDSVDSQSQLRVILLLTLFNRLETSDKDVIFSNWSKILNILSQSKRESFLHEFSAAAQFVRKVSGIHALQNIIFYIREVSNWWK